MNIDGLLVHEYRTGYVPFLVSSVRSTEGETGFARNGVTQVDCKNLWVWLVGFKGLFCGTGKNRSKNWKKRKKTIGQIHIRITSLLIAPGSGVDIIGRENKQDILVAITTLRINAESKREFPYAGEHTTLNNHLVNNIGSPPF